MTGKDRERELKEVREMDELFRNADFAAEVPGLEGRIWLKIQAKLADRELDEDDLEKLAAARGEPDFSGKFPKV